MYIFKNRDFICNNCNKIVKKSNRDRIFVLPNYSELKNGYYLEKIDDDIYVVNNLNEKVRIYKTFIEHP